MAGKKLLVADDSLTIQKVIRLALSNEGYEIQAVSDGNDAIQQISLFRPDVVLIDVSLPGKTAFEVKRAINEQEDLEEVRFVLMSSAFEKVDEPQAEEVRFHGRLTKPFDPAHLRQVLSEVLAQVTAKRMEPTSILQRPAQTPVEMPPMPSMMTPPPPADAESEPSPTLDLTPPDAPTQGHIDLPEDWMSPLSAPAEPIVPEKLSEPVGELWEKESEPAAAPPPGEEPDDIKQLTESTIRMSGLDDFQWSVQEPSLKPPPSMLEATGTTFYVERAGEGLEGMPPFQPERASVPAPLPEEPPVSPTEEREMESALSNVSSLPPPATDAKPPSAFYRDPGTSGGTASAPAASAGAEVTAKITRPQQMPPMPPEANVIPISAEQMEALIRKQLEETFERMAGKLLPELAEKIIKQEIHRMLSEQP